MIRKEFERLVEECCLTECLGCGKCTSCCPFSELFGDLRRGRSPRHIIEAALFNADLIDGDTIWCCPTCNECTERCPAGVRIRDFLTGIRRLAIKSGNDAHAVNCKRCGSYILPETSHNHLVGKLMGEGGQKPEFLFFCPRCRAVDHSRRVKETLPGSLQIPQMKTG
ncbi:MAG: 4Fe-4S dicluster domain-containing protein [Candidatus Glassbacteria bacterium]